MSTILFDLRQTRSEAISHLQMLDNSNYVPTMEPLIPGLASILREWTSKLGVLSALVDEQRVFTDTVLDKVGSIAPWDIGLNDRFAPLPGAQVREVVRGVSKGHYSIQLADLVAGAGQAVARRHVGTPSSAGEFLWPAIVPLISARGMFPHDEPARFAVAGALDRR